MVEHVDAGAGDPKPSLKHAPIMHRPIITLIVFAFLAALLIFRFSLSLSAELITNTLDFDFPLLNSTLAELAQSDPSDDSLQKDIALLLKGDLDNLDLRSWRRSVDIRSPAFRSLYNLRFLPLLSNWSSSRRQSLPAEDTLSHLLPGLLGRSHKYSSCAVVGNSGILLNSNHGPSIDSHEAVIRLNNARITPFPNHVGTKTTLSFVNSNILHLCSHGDCSYCHPYGPSVPLLLYICQPIHLLDFAACNNSSTFHVTNPAFDLLCSKIVKYYSLRRWFSSPDPQLQNRTLQGWFAAHDGIMFHYSSGMQAVMTAVGVCESVSLFGFGKAANAKHHYHTNQRAELDLHDYEAEYELYHDLAERPHTIPFLSGIHLPPVQIYY